MKNSLNKSITIFCVLFIYVIKLKAQDTISRPINFDNIISYPNLSTYTTISQVDSLINEQINPEPIDTTTGNGNSNVNTDDKNIYWIHGLGGNIGDWEKPALVTEIKQNLLSNPIFLYPGWKARMAKSILPVYPGSSNSIQTSYPDIDLGIAGQVLHSSMINTRVGDCPLPNRDVEVDFIIAHSQGGIVSRTYDLLANQGTFNNTSTIYPNLNGRIIGGIATFGSPHLGARIINNSSDPSPKNSMLIKDFADPGAAAIAAALLITKTSNIPLIGSFIPALIGSKIDSVVKYVTQTIIPDKFKNNTAAIAQTFKEGAPFLNTLASNDVTSSVAKAVFYGIEDEPIIWRTFDNFLIHNPQSDTVFRANEDIDLTIKANQYLIEFKIGEILQNTEAKKNHNLFVTTLISSIGIPPPFNITALALAKFYKNKRDANYENARTLLKANNWLGSANNQWKVIIGALDIQQVQTGCLLSMQVCTKKFFMPWKCFALGIPVAGVTPCTGANFSYLNIASSNYSRTVVSALPIYNYIYVYKLSDGVVTTDSQKGYPGHSYTPQLMKGSNHMQMKNDENTRIALDNLFKGRANFNPLTQTTTFEISPFFITAERP